MLLELPSLTAGRFFASILRTAMSLVSSAPSTLAGYTVPSRAITETLFAPATTCAFVTMTPSLRTTNPVPNPACVRGCARPKNKSNGSCGDWSTTSVCTVTTDGATFATAAVIAFCRLCDTWLLLDATGPDACALDGSGSREQPIATARR